MFLYVVLFVWKCVIFVGVVNVVVRFEVFFERLGFGGFVGWGVFSCWLFDMFVVMMK